MVTGPAKGWHLSADARDALKQIGQQVVLSPEAKTAFDTWLQTGTLCEADWIQLEQITQQSKATRA